MAGNTKESGKHEKEIKESEHPAKDNPEEHGEIPRTRDDSEDHKKDPYKDQ
ncbi:hypothetical protein [Erwinia sp.]|uniref:hypothetical protein n=1 Tax=Erwinia citreus TaxID=558 RepID=UPI003C727C95